VPGYRGRDAEEGGVEASKIAEDVSFTRDAVKDPCVKRTPLPPGLPSVWWNLAGRVSLLQQKVPESI
jgi:hypothetical protein